MPSVSGDELSKAFITRLKNVRPRFQKTQEESLKWLAAAHAVHVKSEDAPRLEKLMRRVSCSPAQIGFRGHETELNFHDKGTEDRTLLYRDAALGVFDQLLSDTDEAPEDLIHVTCTGYISPSPAQIQIQKRGWSRATKVTHAYHMGCYAAFPAVRQALGFLKCSHGRVDVVHTEMCSLHVNPRDHAPEQMVVQSLFSDGFIRYSLQENLPEGSSLEVLVVQEEVIPDTVSAMTWVTGDFGMKMTLSKDVPPLISAELRGFIDRLLGREGLLFDREKSEMIFAIHPGGPKILGQVSETLGLAETQIRHSRQVLFEHGNMSSATIPHIWEKIVGDAHVKPGTLILSLAFGPGLTICGALMQKR